MPSVFFVSLMSASPWGGSEELWYRTALMAARRGWKVGCAVYHWHEKEQKQSVLQEAGAEIFYLPNKGRSKRNLVERIQNKFSKSASRRVINSLPVHEYDLTVINMGAFEIITKAWQHFYKKPHRYVVLYHNYREKEVFTGRKKEIIQSLIDGALLNLFASRRIKETLVKNSGIQITSDEILINPISFETPATVTKYPLADEGIYRFIMLAALEVNRKAQDVLISALSATQWQQRKWELHLYGEGKDRELLQDLINQHQMQHRIFLKGHTSDVRKALEESHLLLQLTRQDAMPLSVIEALAVGRPVAVTDVGDMPDWIIENENGWICKQATEEEINQTLERAWQQKEKWKEMGEASFQLFKEKFPASVEATLLEKLETLIKN